MELGGKSANIYFDDCDFDQAIDGAQLGILFNQGQVCCAGSRIFVQDTIYDKFVPALVKAFNKVKVGLPWNDDTQMGSQINETQIKKILSYVEIAKQEGATIACGGRAGQGCIYEADADYQCNQRYACGAGGNLRTCCRSYQIPR